MVRKININKPGNSTAILILANTGARFDINKLKGISHFLEHMMFKGTTSRNAKQISYAIESCGGDLNAFTDWEVTGYWARVGNEYRQQALEVLMDMLQNSTFPIEEVQKERNVIIQELKMYKDSPRYQCFDRLNEVMFSEQSGFYLPVGGTIDTVNNITQKDLVQHYKKHYKDIVVIQVGDVETSEDATLNKTVRALERVSLPTQKFHYFKRKDVSQANVLISNVVSMEGVSTLDSMYAFSLLGAVYNDMSGRLFSEVREKNNLVYRIHALRESYTCGAHQWYVSLGLDTDKIEQAYDLVIKELTRPITKEELEYASKKLVGSTELGLDDPLNVAKIVAYASAKGLDPKELTQNYKAHIARVGQNLNDYLKIIDYSKNVVVGVVPEETK